jgi:hypothetical protein
MNEREALGVALGLITKHGLAVALAKASEAGDGEDFRRLEAARAVNERPDPVYYAAPVMFGALHIARLALASAAGHSLDHGGLDDGQYAALSAAREHVDKAIKAAGGTV